MKDYFIKHLRFWDCNKYSNSTNKSYDSRNVFFKIKREKKRGNSITDILNSKSELLNATQFIDVNNKNIIEYNELKKIWKYILPKNFKWEEYKNLYTDLLDLDEDEVKNHYLLYGNYEKRIYRKKILILEEDKIPVQREVTYNIKLLSSPSKIAYLKKKEEEDKKIKHKKIKIKIFLENLIKHANEEKIKKQQENKKQDNSVSKTDSQCKNITIIICFNCWGKEKLQEALRLFESLNKQTYKNYNVFIVLKDCVQAAYFLKENIRNLKDFIIIEEEFNYKNIFCSIKNHVKDDYLIILDTKDYFLSNYSLEIINKISNVEEFITWESTRENNFCIYSNIIFTELLNNFKTNADFINKIRRHINRYHIPEYLIEYQSVIARENISNELVTNILPYFSKDSFYNTYFKNITEIPIFYINLDRSKDRNDAIIKNISETQKLFDSKNIKLDVHRVSGVDGTKKENLNNLFVNEIVTVKKDTELGCLCSHLLSIKRAYEKGCNFAIICEDDIDLKPLFYNYDFFIESTKYLHNCYEIIQTYVINEKGNYKSNYNNCSPFLKWHWKHWSTASYIITRPAMKRVVEYFFKGDKVKNLYMNIFVADLLLYSLCDTITSSIPLCNILPVNSLIQQNYDFDSMQSNAIIECNIKNEEIKTLYNINRVPFSDEILNGDYLIFTSMGDNSDAYRRWIELIKESNLKIDLVIYYYGDNNDRFNEIKESCDLAVMRKGVKFDNLFYFFQTYRDNLDLSNYKRVAVLDDDIDLKCESCNPLDRLFLISELFNPYISGPSCSTTAKNHVLSFWKQTHHNEDTLCHYSNFVEVGTPIFRMDCLKYLMNLCYKYKMPSWGSDIFFINMLGFDLKDKYLIIDDVQFINPTLEKKNVTVREIDAYCTEREEKLKWLKIAKKYNLKHTVNLYTLDELLPKYKVYSKNFKISNIKTQDLEL